MWYGMGMLTTHSFCFSPQLLRLRLVFQIGLGLFYAAMYTSWGEEQKEDANVLPPKGAWPTYDLLEGGPRGARGPGSCGQCLAGQFF